MFINYISGSSSPIIISWIVTLTEPTSVSLCGVNLPPFSLWISELDVTSHLQTPASLKTVLEIFNFITSGPFSTLYLSLSTIIVVPSGAIQVMLAGGLLSKPVPQMSNEVSPNSAYCCDIGASVAKDGGSDNY